TPTFERLVQADIGPLTREPDEVALVAQATIRARRTDLKARVVDVFDFEHARQVAGDGFAIFDSHTAFPIDRDSQQTFACALNVDQLDVHSCNRLFNQCVEIDHA